MYGVTDITPLQLTGIVWLFDVEAVELSVVGLVAPLLVMSTVSVNESGGGTGNAT